MTILFNSMILGSGTDKHNKGWFATPEALRAAYPTATNGDYAIVGSTDTVWVWNSSTTSWKDTDTKGQVSSVNDQTGDVKIKTVNGNSLMGTGDVTVKTYSAFPSDFTTTGTLAQIVESIKSSSGKGQGKAYLGTISGACMPYGSGNGECKVEYMTDGIAVLTLNSSNTPPYNWVYNTDASNLNPPDYTWKHYIVQYSNDLPTRDVPDGTIVQYAGTTNANYTKGYFYKANTVGYTCTWEQWNVQPSGGSAITSSSHTIATTDWSNNTATLTVPGVTASSEVFVSPGNTLTNIKAYASSRVFCSAIGVNTVTMSCETTPVENITVIVGVC